MRKVKVGLYGTNGHQIQHRLTNHREAELVAVAGFDEHAVPDGVGEVRRYDGLGALLEDREVELVSLCSPFRSEQAGHAIAGSPTPFAPKGPSGWGWDSTGTTTISSGQSYMVGIL